MKRLMVVLALLGLCATTYADYVTGFEPPLYVGSPEGTLLTGQDAWYNPVEGSADYLVFTYAGNAYGFPDNPGGGDEQFAAGMSDGGTAYGRAQRDVDFSGRDEWTIVFDTAAKYLGTPPATDYLGSFSLQPSATNTYFQTLDIWQDLNNPGLWMANYVTEEFPAPGTNPGAAWQNLSPDHWYRQWTTFRFSDRLILEVGITDLHTGESTTVSDPGWHLIPMGGALPTGVRFFSGGTVAGNTMAWDNCTIMGEVECPGDIDGDGDTDHSDLGELLAAWCTQAGDPNWNPNADLDGDGHVGHGDLGILLADWGCGVP